MKTISTRLMTISLAAAVCLALPSPALAEGEAWLRLSANTFDVEAGKEFTVDVLVENAPEVYGIDVQLVFDPAVLQVVDADQAADGVQLAVGSFFDAGQSHFLQNTADNAGGTIDLAMTLLNPAPSVKGDGLLCQITFKAVSAGRATVSIRDGLFGTRTGETIAPQFEGRGVWASDGANAANDPGGSGAQDVDAGSAPDPQTSAQAAGNAGPSINLWLIAGLVALLVAGIAIGFFLSRRFPGRTGS